MSFSSPAAFELLSRAYQNGRLAHAYLITGAEPRSTRSLTMQVASLVTGGADASEHPDVHMAEPESKSRRIRVEQTRALERELQMRSSGGGRKVAVVFDADRMTTEAANAFLKTLEEPPNHSLLLLTSSAPETLPDTILSRCITVSLLPEARPPLTTAQTALLDALGGFSKEKESGVSSAFRLVQIFLDQLRAARETLSEENAAAQRADEARYKQTTDAKTWLDDREDHYKALTEARYIQQRFALVDTLLEWWADVLRTQHGFPSLDLDVYSADTARVAQRFTVPEALARVAALEELRENLNRPGVQEQLAIEVAFLTAFA